MSLACPPIIDLPIFEVGRRRIFEECCGRHSLPARVHFDVPLLWSYRREVGGGQEIREESRNRCIDNIHSEGTSDTKRVPLLLGFRAEPQLGGGIRKDSEILETSKRSLVNHSSNECLSMLPYYGATNDRWGVSKKSGKILEIVASAFALWIGLRRDQSESPYC